LERQRVDGLELVLSRSQSLPTSEISRDSVLRHAEVVEELMTRSAAVLPAQLGRAFRDEAELTAAVRALAPQLERGLERVRGCVEFGLRAVPTEHEGELDAGTGTDYMRARLEQVQRGDRLVAQLHEPLARLANEVTLRQHGGELSAAYLVAREDAAAFQQAVARLERSPEVTVVCTGPWPPYSFAAEAGQ
jgi:hypothetical protein